MKIVLRRPRRVSVYLLLLLINAIGSLPS